MQESEGTVVIQEHEIDREDASFVKIKILAGYKDFTTLQQVSIFGKSSREAK